MQFSQPSLPSDRFLPAAILLIEDDRALLGMVEQLLVQEGYRVLAAASAIEAHRAESQYAGTIPLIVSDVHLGGDRGPGIVRAIRSRRDRVAALYMSGHEQGQALDADDLEPGDGFMPKPFSPGGFLAQVRSALSLSGSRS
jgi:two-component system, OmpR family, phosphate regulon response regulator OmpR